MPRVEGRIEERIEGRMHMCKFNETMLPVLHFYLSLLIATLRLWHKHNAHLHLFLPFSVGDTCRSAFNRLFSVSHAYGRCTFENSFSICAVRSYTLRVAYIAEQLHSSSSSHRSAESASSLPNTPSRILLFCTLFICIPRSSSWHCSGLSAS